MGLSEPLDEGLVQRIAVGRLAFRHVVQLAGVGGPVVQPGLRHFPFLHIHHLGVAGGTDAAASGRGVGRVAVVIRLESVFGCLNLFL